MRRQNRERGLKRGGMATLMVLVTALSVGGRPSTSIPTGTPTEQPDASSYEVGFAVVSRIPGSLELPFFSKVNLRNSARTLKGLGYRITLTKIEVALSR